MSETLQEHVQLKAQREKVIEVLKDDIAAKDKLIGQLSEEKEDHEKEFGELRRCCKNAEEKQWIAERRASYTSDKYAAKESENQAKCDKLEKNLRETEVREQKHKDKLEEKTRDFEEGKQRAEAIVEEHLGMMQAWKRN